MVYGSTCRYRPEAFLISAITSHISEIVSKSKIKNGLVNIFVLVQLHRFPQSNMKRLWWKILKISWKSFLTPCTPATHRPGVMITAFPYQSNLYGAGNNSSYFKRELVLGTWQRSCLSIMIIDPEIGNFCSGHG